MTRDTRRGEMRLSRGSLHRHQVLLEPGHSFTSPESWIPWDWRLSLNWAPSSGWTRASYPTDNGHMLMKNVQQPKLFCHPNASTLSKDLSSTTEGDSMLRRTCSIIVMLVYDVFLAPMLLLLCPECNCLKWT